MAGSWYTCPRCSKKVFRGDGRANISMICPNKLCPSRRTKPAVPVTIKVGGQQ